MSFDKDQYWKDKPYNIGRIRNIDARDSSERPMPPSLRHVFKKLSKYAIRKNTKRARKAATNGV